jgi:hypothetical protein
VSAIGPKRTFLVAPHMSAFGGKADIRAPNVASIVRVAAGAFGFLILILVFERPERYVYCMADLRSAVSVVAGGAIHALRYLPALGDFPE